MPRIQRNARTWPCPPRTPARMERQDRGIEGYITGSYCPWPSWKETEFSTPYRVTRLVQCRWGSGQQPIQGPGWRTCQSLAAPEHWSPQRQERRRREGSQERGPCWGRAPSPPPWLLRPQPRPAVLSPPGSPARPRCRSSLHLCQAHPVPCALPNLFLIVLSLVSHYKPIKGPKLLFYSSRKIAHNLVSILGHIQHSLAHPQAGIWIILSFRLKHSHLSTEAPARKGAAARSPQLPTARSLYS